MRSKPFHESAARAALLAVVAATVAVVLACAPDAPPAGLVALPHPDGTTGDPTRPHFHDFGRVPFGEIASHTFRFENTDPVPVTIRQVQSSCGCSVTQLRRVDARGNVVEQGRHDEPGALLTVPPGGLCEIEIRVDTRAVPQADSDKLVTVRVATDSAQRPWITLEAHLVADLGFDFVPRVLEMTRVPQGVGGEGEVLIRQDGDLGLVLTGVEDAPPGFEVRLADDPRGIGPQWQLMVALPPGHPPGATQGTVRLATRYPDGRTGRPLQIPVFARVVADIDVQPSHLVLRSRGAAAALEQELRVTSLVEGLRFRIESGAATDAGSAVLSVELVPEEPDARGRARAWTVRVSASRAALEGAPRGTLRLVLDDPQIPALEVPYVAVLQ